MEMEKNQAVSEQVTNARLKLDALRQRVEAAILAEGFAMEQGHHLLLRALLAGCAVTALKASHPDAAAQVQQDEEAAWNGLEALADEAERARA